MLLIGIKACATMKVIFQWKQYGIQHLQFPYVDIFINVNSLANILSMSSVTTKYRVTINSSIGNSVLARTTKSRDPIKYARCGNRIYHFDTGAESKTKESVVGYSLLSTVDVNNDYFTRREIEGADDARIL